MVEAPAPLVPTHTHTHIAQEFEGGSPPGWSVPGSALACSQGCAQHRPPCACSCACATCCR
eukprot:8240285-Prorocentrum_lima.AAC.1